jgi:predicted ester cyclase
MKRSIIAIIIAAAFSIPAHQAAASASCSAKTVAQNKINARTVFEEILSKGHIAENEHIYHSKFIAHGPKSDSNRDDDRAATIGWRKMAPDLRMEVLKIVGECEFVVVHWSGSGTNTGEGNGLPATGKSLSNLWGMTIFRFEQGKIREEWTSFDQYAMLEQLGMLK